MDKAKFVQFVCDRLEKDLAALKEVARATAEAATHEEAKPENQYDTRALENSYLAGAQSKRVVETEEALVAFKNMDVKNFAKGEAIASSALVEVDLNGEKKTFFMAPKGGGLSVDFEGKRIMIITPSSPVGEALQGLKAGQTVDVDRGNETLEYEVLSVR